MKTKRTQNAKVAAVELDVSEKTLRRWCNRKIGPVPHDRGAKGIVLVDVPEVAAWMKANNITGEPGRPDNATPDAKAEKIRHVKAMADYWELRVAKERNELIPVADVVTWVIQNVSVARNNFVGLGAWLAAQTEGRDATDRQSICDNRVNEILTDLSSGLSRLPTAK